MNEQKTTSIPITKHCIFAMMFDKTKNTEHILIGEMSEVEKYLRKGEEADIVFETIRPFGTFILECSTPITSQLADIRAALVGSVGIKKSPYFVQSREKLIQMYNSDNLVHKFISLAIWQEYNKACKNRQTDLYTLIEDISLPLMFSLKDDIIEWQEDTPNNPLSHLECEYFKYHAFVLYGKGKGMKEFYAVEKSLLPLVVYYLKTIYDSKTYIQTCKLCGKLFRANTANIPTLCSNECKRDQARINKHKFDERAKETPYERQYKNEYMYWYNKVKKLQLDEKFDRERLKEIEKTFSNFCNEALKKKAQVKKGKADENEFCAWILKQRDIIDGIMTKFI